MWRIPSGKNTDQILLTDENPQRDLTINDIYIAAYVVHLHIFASLMYPLERTATKVDNTAAEGWEKRGSVISAISVGPLL